MVCGHENATAMCEAIVQPQQRNIVEEQELLVSQDRIISAQLQQASPLQFNNRVLPLLSLSSLVYRKQGTTKRGVLSGGLVQISRFFVRFTSLLPLGHQ
jgi:hypothetical protein